MRERPYETQVSLSDFLVVYDQLAERISMHEAVVARVKMSPVNAEVEHAEVAEVVCEGPGREGYVHDVGRDGEFLDEVCEGWRVPCCAGEELDGVSKVMVW